MNTTGEGGKGSARRKGSDDQAYADAYDAVFSRDKKIARMRTDAEKAGIEFTINDTGHVQLKGPHLVNYYPFSKKCTMYVEGAARGRSVHDFDIVIRHCLYGK